MSPSEVARSAAASHSCLEEPEAESAVCELLGTTLVSERKHTSRQWQLEQSRMHSQLVLGTERGLPNALQGDPLNSDLHSVVAAAT